MLRPGRLEDACTEAALGVLAVAHALHAARAGVICGPALAAARTQSRVHSA
jgi:hypothetical protein